MGPVFPSKLFMPSTRLVGPYDKALASNQALPLRALNIKCKKLKEGKSLEDFDHVLDMVGCGFQLVIDVAHALRPLMLTHDSAVFSMACMEPRTINNPSVPTIRLVMRSPEASLNTDTTFAQQGPPRVWHAQEWSFRGPMFAKRYPS